ncbi:hypothetical protein COU37_04330 [Candidatus Micrarchaeota archaeon CG10_big_fil_rev_8_21_14_0_10_45_29]|nr:MAG: hypothetical protein COU37_04330 [Candidatus Micrarchaeota archaeon CG10_big_fil_rev_8_21_14_0_10_45_29]
MLWASGKHSTEKERDARERIMIKAQTPLMLFASPLSILKTSKSRLKSITPNKNSKKLKKYFQRPKS